MSISEQHCRREEILDATSRSGLLVEISEFSLETDKPPSGGGGSLPVGSKALNVLEFLASAVKGPSYMISSITAT